MEETEIKEYVAEQVEKLLALRKLSQQDLSELTQLSQTYISLIVNKKRMPSMKTIAKIAKAFDVQPRDLIPQGANLENGSTFFDKVEPPLKNVTHAEMPVTLKDIPLMGVVVAGRPLLSTATLGETVSIPSSMCKGKGECYALRVSGESMIGDLIGDGDCIVVRAQNWAENGAMAICEVNGEGCLKHFFLKQDRVELKSKNPDYPPIIAPAQDVVVRGVVVGLLRSYKNGFE